jgi:hypothetical protein
MLANSLGTNASSVVVIVQNISNFLVVHVLWLRDAALTLFLFLSERKLFVNRLVVVGSVCRQNASQMVVLEKGK